MKVVKNNKHLLLKTALFYLFFALIGLNHEASGQSYTGSDSAAADFKPWSGYWWPLKEGGTATGKGYQGEPAPLQKYDNVSRLNGSATKWELANHYMRDAKSWFGHCHAWAAASILEEEPRTGINEFLVGDQKALLTELHYDDLAHFVGSRYNGPGDDRNDLYPDQFNSVLFDYVKKQGKPIVMDLDAGEQVWNYPVYKYEMRWRDEGRRKYFETRIWYASNNVSPDYVGTKEDTKTYHYYYEDTDGDGVYDQSAWMGESVRDHPDFAWAPYQRKDENPYLDPGIVRKVIAGQLTSRPEVVATQPPPQPAPQPTPPVPPQPSPAPRLTVKVWGDGGNGLGDEVKIYFSASANSYITLFDIGSSGKIVKLFPNEFDKENFAAGGRVYQVPQKDGEYRIKVDPSGPKGVETVVAVATTTAENLSVNDLPNIRPGWAVATWTFEIR